MTFGSNFSTTAGVLVSTQDRSLLIGVPVAGSGSGTAASSGGVAGLKPDTAGEN
jgi:hypothetical protein